MATTEKVSAEQVFAELPTRDQKVDALIAYVIDNATDAQVKKLKDWADEQRRQGGPVGETGPSTT